MKFNELDGVRTLVDKDNTPANSVGTIICAFTSPNEAYMVEFVNSKGEMIDSPIYLPERLVAD